MTKKRATASSDAAEAALSQFRSHAIPPTISLSTAEPVHLSAAERELWASDQGGQFAARRGAEFDKLRLIGSVELNISCAWGEPSQALGLQLRPVKPRPADHKWGWNRRQGGRPPPPSAPLEAWDKGTGEVTGQGFASPSSLLRALQDGSATCEQPWGSELLEALTTFATPDPGLWGCPLIRAIIVPPREVPRLAPPLAAPRADLGTLPAQLT